MLRLAFGNNPNGARQIFECTILNARLHLKTQRFFFSNGYLRKEVLRSIRAHCPQSSVVQIQPDIFPLSLLLEMNDASIVLARQR
jgi:hypothetical protein